MRPARILISTRMLLVQRAYQVVASDRRSKSPVTHAWYRNPSRKTGSAAVTRSILRYANDGHGELHWPWRVSVLSLSLDIGEPTSSITQKLVQPCRRLPTAQIVAETHETKECSRTYNESKTPSLAVAEIAYGILWSVSFNVPDDVFSNDSSRFLFSNRPCRKNIAASNVGETSMIRTAGL